METDEGRAVLKYTLDAEQIIEDRLLLRRVVEKQDELDQFIRDHMETEEAKFAKIEKYLMIMAVGMVMIATGMDLSQILSLVSSVVF